MAKNDNKNPFEMIKAILFFASIASFLFLIYQSPLSFIVFILILFFMRNFIARCVLGISFIPAFFLVNYIEGGKEKLLRIYDIYTSYFSAESLIKSEFDSAITFFKKFTTSDVSTYFIEPFILSVLFAMFALIICKIVIYRHDPMADMLKRMKAKNLTRAKKYNFKKAEHSPNNQYLPLGVSLADGKTPRGLAYDSLRQHVCVIGTTGSGKTVTLYHFVIDALMHGKPVIFVDGKGDSGNIVKFRATCDYFGKKPLIVTMDGTTGYNPFGVGTPGELTDKIIGLFDWSEEHYKLSASRFVQLLIKYMQIQKIPCNLPNIVKYCDLKALVNFHLQQQPRVAKQESQAAPMGAEDTGISFDIPAPISPEPIAKEQPQEQTEADELLEKLRGMDTKSIQGLQNRIAQLAEGDLEPMFNAKNSLNLSETIENGQAVLFSLDSLRYPAQSRGLGRLVVNDLKNSISRHGKNNSSPVCVIFDEFNVFASHEVVDVVNKSRSAGFEVVLAFQSLADIDKLEAGEALRRQILENCNTLIVQRQNDPKDAEELAAAFGTYSTIATTVQMDSKTSTGMESAREIREFVVHPDQIKKLDTGEAFIKFAGAVAAVRIAPN